MGGPVPAVGPNPAGGVRNPVLVGEGGGGGPAREAPPSSLMSSSSSVRESVWKSAGTVVELYFLGSPEIGWPSIASLWMDDLATA